MTKNSGMGSPVKLMAAAAGSVDGTDARAQLARFASVFEARASANKACAIVRRRLIGKYNIMRLLVPCCIAKHGKYLRRVFGLPKDPVFPASRRCARP